MPVDAVVVLANLMEADGRLNEDSARRAARAAELYRALQAKTIITCGWSYRDDSTISIGDALKKHCVLHHRVSEGSVLVEANSRDTVGDAYFTKVNIVRPRGWTGIVVVTSDYHVARTREVFEFVYGPCYRIRVVGVRTAMVSSKKESERESLEAFRRTFLGVPRGDSDAILDRLRSHHPFYNGQVHSRI